MAEDQAPPGFDELAGGNSIVSENSAIPTPVAGPIPGTGNEPPPGFDQLANQGEYSGLIQTPLAAIESFNRQRSLGLSDVLETKLGFSTPEAIRGRQEENPGTTFAAGILGGASTGGFGITQGVKKALGSGFAATIAGHALEGGAFGLGNAVSESALGDSQLNGEQLLAHVGMGAALGGGIGVLSKALGALPAMLRRAPSEAIGGAEAAAEPGTVTPEAALAEAGFGKEVPRTKAEEMTQFGAPNGDSQLRNVIPLESMHPEDQAGIVDGLNNLKPNADEVITAGRMLNAPTPEGMLTDSDHLQKIDYALINSPSPAGIARNQLYNQGYQAASKAVSGALGEGTESSLAQVGIQAKQMMSESIETKYAPIKELYSKIDEIAPQIPVFDSTTSRVSKGISDIINEEGLIRGTPEHSFVKTFADGLDQVTDLNRLKNFRTALQRATTPETRYVSSLIKEKLDNVELDAVKRFGDQIDEPAAKQAVADLTGQLVQAKQSYAGFRDEIGKVGKLLWGGKKIYGAQDFLDKIDAETPEKFATRLFAKNNSEAVQWMSQEFPQVTQLLGQLERSKIRTASLVKGEFSPVKALKTINELSPELKNVMFTPEEQATFKAGKIYMDNLLPNFNPSGTASASQFHEFIKSPLSTTASWAKDFGIGKYLEHSVKLTPEQRQELAAQAERLEQVELINLHTLGDLPYMEGRFQNNFQMTQF
jgi:hypothetical protein